MCSSIPLICFFVTSFNDPSQMFSHLLNSKFSHPPENDGLSKRYIDVKVLNQISLPLNFHCYDYSL